MPIQLSIQDLGTVDYLTTWELQRTLQKDLISGSGKEYFLFCEHYPVLTYGGSTNLEEVLKVSAEELKQDKVELIKSDRGGNVTFHGEGQLVCYLIIDLKRRKKDVDWFLRSIEQVVIEVLAHYNIAAIRIPSQTGVWISENDKICSIGVRLSRWCSMHGLALNITKKSEQGFSRILPCGIANARAISIETISGEEPKRQELIDRVSKAFLKHFYQDFHLDLSISR